MAKEKAEAIALRFVKNISAVGKARGGLGELEKRAGISTGYISRLCVKKKRGMSLVTALLLADAVGESLQDLLSKDYTAISVDMRIEALEKELAELKGLKDQLQGDE